MSRTNKYIQCSVLIYIICFFIACGGKDNNSNIEAKVIKTDLQLPDTLRVGTLYSPTSYFIYKEEPMGYEYDMVKQFAEDKGLELEIVVSKNLNSLIELLDSCKVDLLAYEIPHIAEYKERLLPCGLENITYQVLVQPKIKSKPLISDVTELVGETIYVEKNSKYQSRLENLNEELGGGIKIKELEADSLITEDMIEMVSNKKIPMTIVDSDIAQLNKTYYKDLDVSLKVSLNQKASWAVRLQDKWLADTINEWAKYNKTKDDYKRIHKRYFEISKNISIIENKNIMIGNGVISIYDELFKKHSKTINWDWRILAAQAYVESRFDTTVVSWAGARGLMQIMPRTAVANGLPLTEITNADRNLETAIKVIKSLDGSLSKRVKDVSERQKFVLAAYNSGLAHILDAIALANKYGKNPEVWEENVRDALLMKSRPEYYNDPVVKYGYFRGTQTVKYVDKVIRIFSEYKNKIPM